ncbi:MAG TPA: hypothetical protein VF553_03190 [Pyrinomonadaceae bacterium]|jgi:hypothetical protein
MSRFRFTGDFTIRSIACAALLALVGCAAPRLATAQTSGQSADGSFSYSQLGGPTKTIEFRSIVNKDGSTTGQMSFSGPETFPDQDVDGTGRAGFSGKIENLQIDVDFDGMVVDKTRAVMSGTVRGSTLSDYIGQRVLLVVEDNGTGIEDKARPDEFTFGLYRPKDITWIPTDAERKDDNGWSLNWIATDAERRDDVGVPYRRSTEITAQTFPLSSYDFVDISNGVGNIRVQP